jgi:hypothetical protein
LLSTAHRVLSTTDAREYLTIVTAFFATISSARSLVDVNIAAGVAHEDLEEFREKLLGDESGQVPGKPELHVLKPI